MSSYTSSQGELDIDEFLLGCYQLLAHGSHGFAWPFWILFAVTVLALENAMRCNENMWIVAFMAEIPIYIHLHPVAKAARWCNRLERQSRRVKQQVGSSGHRIWHHKLGLFGRLFGSIGSIWQSSRWFGILWESGVPGGWEEISGEISILFRDISGFIDNLLILIPHIV